MTALLLAFFSLANAQGLDEALIRRLASASSAAQVRRLEEQADALRVARLACRIQLRERRIPAACYSALKLERNFGLASGRGTERELDRKCESGSRRLKSPIRIEMSALSRSCRDSVRRALELLAYKLETEE